MALNGGEPTSAMGADTPIPAMSKKNPPLFDYFKQMFAQVTNPPIDSIRESVITDTTVYLGVSGNILEEDERNCRVLKVNNPILTNLDMMKIRGMDIDGLKPQTFPCCIPRTFLSMMPLKTCISRQRKHTPRVQRF